MVRPRRNVDPWTERREASIVEVVRALGRRLATRGHGRAPAPVAQPLAMPAPPRPPGPPRASPRDRA